MLEQLCEADALHHESIDLEIWTILSIEPD